MYFVVLILMIGSEVMTKKEKQIRQGLMALDSRKFFEILISSRHPIYTQRGQHRSDNFGNILQTKASFGKC